MKVIDMPIIMTSKGTFTLPAKVRKQIGVTKKGDRLRLRYTPGSKKIELEAAVDFQALQTEIAGLIPESLKPLPDLREIRRQKHQEYYDDHFA